MPLVLQLTVRFVVRAIGKSFGPDSECIASMHLYVWFWRITRGNAFSFTRGLTFFFYAWFMLVPIIGVIFLRLWSVVLFHDPQP